ncbi:MAG: hypothetical protein V7785_25070 [Bermanella sp.]
MRIFISALLLLSVQSAFAIPTATTEQCAKWTKNIAEYNDKQRHADSLEKKAYYLSKIDEYEIRRRMGRCRGR